MTFHFFFLSSASLISGQHFILLQFSGNKYQRSIITIHTWKLLNAMQFLIYRSRRNYFHIRLLWRFAKQCSKYFSLSLKNISLLAPKKNKNNLKYFLCQFSRGLELLYRNIWFSSSSRKNISLKNVRIDWNTLRTEIVWWQTQILISFKLFAAIKKLSSRFSLFSANRDK